MALPFSRPLAGLLIPVFALRHEHDFGIGDTHAMLGAIDFCADHGFSVLQTLPIHDTIGDHSPYNPVSTRAFSAALLSISESDVPGFRESLLKDQVEEGWLSQLRQGSVKYHAVHALKLKLLLATYEQFKKQPDEDLRKEFEQFQSDERDWLPAFTLFRLLAIEYDNNPHWDQWRSEHQSFPEAEKWLMSNPDNSRLAALREGLAYIQWIAHRQWMRVRGHADLRGVMLMGEMSFGVSKYSADVWSRPDLFDIEWSVGTRPVSYFDTNKDSERWGQNWGLPPYRWENHRSEDFAWLRGRLAFESRYFHLCRLDHLRGYFRAYMFPWQGGSQHAQFAALDEAEVLVRTGGRMPRFVPGPDENEITAGMNELQGRELIGIMQSAAGRMGLFGELMGAMPEYMRRTLEEMTLPNLSFPLLEKDSDGKLQHVDSLRRLSLVSYGNHDHASIAGVYRQLLHRQADGNPAAQADLQNLLTFAQWQEAPPDDMNDALLSALQKALFQTHCILACLTVTDLLGTTQRFNLPGSYGDETWCERLELPLPMLEKHAVYGPRIQKAAEWIHQSGRARMG